MLNLNSARHCAGTPHVDQSTKTQNSNSSIRNALRRRAEAVIKNKSIDAETRAKIRYCLETGDPCLAELVRRVDAGESFIETVDFQTPETTEDHPTENDLSEDNPTQDNRSEEKIEALADIICQAGDEPAVALLVLMATLENAAHPKALANLAKHFAFTRCGELNLRGMVDAQITVLERELLELLAQ